MLVLKARSMVEMSFAAVTMQQAYAIAIGYPESCLEAELVELLRIPEAADVGVEEAVLGEDQVSSLHGPEGPAEVADVDGGMPAVIQLRELLRP